MIVTDEMLAEQQAKLGAAIDRLSATAHARIDELMALLRECRDVISDERDILLDSFTLDGDRSTMLAVDAEEVAEFDALLERIHAALGDETPRSCRSCGCTDDDCSGCIERTGSPCHWIEADLCSACAPPDPNPPLHGFAKARTP